MEFRIHNTIYKIVMGCTALMSGILSFNKEIGILQIGPQ